MNYSTIYEEMGIGAMVARELGRCPYLGLNGVELNKASAVIVVGSRENNPLAYGDLVWVMEHLSCCRVCPKQGWLRNCSLRGDLRQRLKVTFETVFVRSVHATFSSLACEKCLDEIDDRGKSPVRVEIPRSVISLTQSGVMGVRMAAFLICRQQNCLVRRVMIETARR